MTARSCQVLLKARPTRAQLADRLSEPVPPGLELYLDARDVGDLERLERLARRLIDLRPAKEFVYVVEGPLRSLDGAFFDISRDTEAQRECVRRIAWLAREIGAEAVLVHAIAPRKLGPHLDENAHRETLLAAVPFVGHYVDIVQALGLTPMLENIPPVARQREAAYMCTPVGMMAADLAFFAERFPGLKVTLDVSHAQLFLNGVRGDLGGDAPRELEPLVRYLATLRGREQEMSGNAEVIIGDAEPGPSETPAPHHPGVAADMEAYIQQLEPHLFEAHFSNARGILDEGLPYGEGDMDLDALALKLSSSIRYLVTETIEPDADRGVYMREAQARMEAALDGTGKHEEQ